MFERSRQGAVSVVLGDGPLNAESAGSLTGVLEECLAEGCPRIVLDMQQVPLIDSAGLELLMDLQETFEQRAGTVKLANPSALCGDILRATGVGDHFEIYPDVKIAVGSFLH